MRRTKNFHNPFSFFLFYCSIVRRYSHFQEKTCFTKYLFKCARIFRGKSTHQGERWKGFLPSYSYTHTLILPYNLLIVSSFRFFLFISGAIRYFARCAVPRIFFFTVVFFAPLLIVRQPKEAYNCSRLH